MSHRDSILVGPGPRLLVSRSWLVLLSRSWCVGLLEEFLLVSLENCCSKESPKNHSGRMLVRVQSSSKRSTIRTSSNGVEQRCRHKIKLSALGAVLLALIWRFVFLFRMDNFYSSDSRCNSVRKSSKRSAFRPVGAVTGQTFDRLETDSIPTDSMPHHREQCRAPWNKMANLPFEHWQFVCDSYAFEARGSGPEPSMFELPGCWRSQHEIASGLCKASFNWQKLWIFFISFRMLDSIKLTAIEIKSFKNATDHGYQGK